MAEVAGGSGPGRQAANKGRLGGGDLRRIQTAGIGNHSPWDGAPFGASNYARNVRYKCAIGMRETG